MKILLVNPNTRYLGMLLTVYPPMGLLYISSVLIKAGYDVRFVDADIDNLTHAQIHDAIRDYNPDLIGITMNTLQSKAAYDLANSIRQQNEVRIVIGGPHPSAMKGEALKKCRSIDFAVLGEGEVTFLELIKALEEDYSLYNVKGICFRDGEEIKENEPCPPIENLDQIPFPALNLAAPIRRYPGPYPVGARPSIHVMASRGCPFQCTFCSNPVWERKLRFRSPKSVLSEVEWLSEMFKVKEIFFQDDTFNIKRDWFEAICNGLIERGLNKKLVFKSPFRANERLLDMDLLRLAKKAGFWMIFYGVESGNQNILDSVKKNLSLEDIERAFKLTKKAGIRTYASFMIGNIGENRATIQDTINFAKRIDPDYYGFAVAIPYPGSEFHELARASGYIDENFDKFDLNKYLLRSGSFKPGEIEELAKQAYCAMEDYRRSKLYRLEKLLRRESLIDGRSYLDYYPALVPPDLEILEPEVTMGNNEWDVLGPGWYALENWPPKVRWTGKKATAYLKRKIDGNQLCINVITSRDGLRLRVSVGDDCAEVTLKSSKWTTIRLPLDNQAKGSRLRVEFEVDRAWIPDEIIKNGDTRSLGVAVERLWQD